MLDRELAWRVFADEYNSSTLHISEQSERAPNYVITPTGAKVNRLFIIGVVTDVENIGSGSDLFRARVADPTGVFTVYAGQYQSEAAIFFSELEVPSFIAVVGKARTYEPESGSIYVSIRPEEVNSADEHLRDRWVLDTAKRTLERAKVMQTALESGLDKDALRAFLSGKGVNDALAEGAAAALSHYTDIRGYIRTLNDAVANAVETVFSGGSAQEKKETISAKKSPKDETAEALNVLDTGSGAAYSELVASLQAKGLSEDEVEGAIKELMDEGRCYEPKIGILRKVQ
ncbi:MAG TPA: DNA-binding protein [Candidatus Methanoperedenaceae archaeon]|nr:DNA-binding protein [Candidatus Methanoperedenaceae archaeon]